MPEVTLVLTRTPIREFIEIAGEVEEVDGLTDEQRLAYYLPKRAKPGAKPSVQHRSGRWGTLGVFRGPKVKSVRFLEMEAAAGGSASSTPAPLESKGNELLLATVGVVVGVGLQFAKAAEPWTGLDLAQLRPTAPAAPKGLVQTLPFNDRTLEFTLETEGEMEKIVEYDSMERFRSDLGARSGYVMLHASPTPYGLRMEAGNSVVKTLRTGYSGNCLRVLGGWAGPEQGILIHEAPTIGWLIGCISPRVKGHRVALRNENGNFSAQAMDGIYDAMGGFKNGRTASLFVMK